VNGSKAAGNQSKQHYTVQNNMCNRLNETLVNNRQATHCHTPQHSTISLSLNGNTVTWSLYFLSSEVKNLNFYYTELSSLKPTVKGTK